MKETRLCKYKKNKVKIMPLVFIISTIFLFQVILFPSIKGKNILASDSSSEGEYENIDVNWSRTPEDDRIKIHGNNFNDNTEVSKKGVFRINKPTPENPQYYTLGYLEKILDPAENKNVWDGKNKNNRYYNDYASRISEDNLAKYPDFATWRFFGNDHQELEWRMFKGTFNLSDIGDKKVFVGLNNKSLIFPINDIVIILVDGKVTKMNFSNHVYNGAMYINGQKLEFTPLYWNEKKEKPACTNSSHLNECINTDYWHAHLDESTNRDGENLRLGDITSYLKDGNNHTIEILAADLCGGGGMSKLEVYCADEPDYSLEKDAYIKDNEGNNKDLVSGDDENKIEEDTDVYYTFSIKNNKNKKFSNANITFQDDNLKVKITNDGVYLDKNNDGNYDKNEEIQDYSDLKITSNGITKEGKEALDLLKVLPENSNYNESIKVDFPSILKHKISEEDAKSGEYKNTVKSYVSYLGGGLTMAKEAEFIVKTKEIEEFNISVNKTIKKYIRNDTEEVDEIEDTKFLPGDKIFFNILIKNNSNREIKKLKLEDTLSNELGEIIKDNNWTIESPEDFDVNNFNLEGKEEVNIVISYDLLEPKAKKEAYYLKNKVIVSKNNEYEESEINFEIERPSLKIKKILDNEGINEENEEKTYSVSIKGSDDSLYNLEAQLNKEYLIKDLFYGVKYTISEIVPMNYTDFAIKNSKLVNLNKNIKITNSSLVEENVSNIKDKDIIYIINKKISNRNFYDDDVKVNTIESLQIGAGDK